MHKESPETTSLAFEYVLGTLDIHERETFAAQMRRDHALQDEVLFWEKHIEMHPHLDKELAPKPDTFQHILQRINQAQETKQTREEPKTSFFDFLFSWRNATVFSFMALVVVVGLTSFTKQDALSPNTDYVAVLVDNAQQPVLTALTASEGSTLHLKWEAFEKPSDQSLQLWSKSRRDGEIRPLFVFDDAQSIVALDQASLRLIRDSSHLIITLEESGGSPFDVPSELVIAEGACVRFSPIDVS